MPWLKREFNDGGVGHVGPVWCWIGGCSLAVGEEWRWQCQIWVESMRAFAVALGFTKPLQVVLRWQTLAQEGSSQCYTKSA